MAMAVLANAPTVAIAMAWVATAQVLARHRATKAVAEAPRTSRRTPRPHQLSVVMASVVMAVLGNASTVAIAMAWAARA